MGRTREDNSVESTGEGGENAFIATRGEEYVQVNRG